MYPVALTETPATAAPASSPSQPGPPNTTCRSGNCAAERRITSSSVSVPLRPRFAIASLGADEADHEFVWRNSKRSFGNLAPAKKVEIDAMRNHGNRKVRGNTRCDVALPSFRADRERSASLCSKLMLRRPLGDVMNPRRDGGQCLRFQIAKEFDRRLIETMNRVDCRNERAQQLRPPLEDPLRNGVELVPVSKAGDDLLSISPMIHHATLGMRRMRGLRLIAHLRAPAARCER